MFKRIVVGIRDEDEAGRDAIVFAKQLVGTDGEIALVHVHVASTPEQLDPAWVGNPERHRYAISRLDRLAHERGIDAATVSIDARSVRRGLHDAASSYHADLLVVSASRRDELMRDMVGDEVSEVLEDPPCPVAVAPVGHSQRAGAVNRIGVICDGSPASDGALVLAGAMAEDHGGTLSAVDVTPAGVNPLDPLSVEGGIDPLDEVTRWGRSLDLLVIGSPRHRPLDRLLGNGPAQRLAAEGSIPLLVLPAPGASSRARGDEDAPVASSSR